MCTEETLAWVGIVFVQYIDSKRTWRRLICDGTSSLSYMFLQAAFSYLQSSYYSNEKQNFCPQHAIV